MLAQWLLLWKVICELSHPVINCKYADDMYTVSQTQQDTKLLLVITKY